MLEPQQRLAKDTRALRTEKNHSPSHIRARNHKAGKHNQNRQNRHRRRLRGLQRRQRVREGAEHGAHKHVGETAVEDEAEGIIEREAVRHFVPDTKK